MRQKRMLCQWLSCVMAWPCLAAGSVEIARVDTQVILSNGAAQISFDLESGRYSGKNLVTGKLAFAEARFRLDAGKRPWRDPKMTYRFEQEDINDVLGRGKRLKVYQSFSRAGRTDGYCERERHIEVHACGSSVGAGLLLLQQPW